MVRGRYVAMNGAPVDAEHFDERDRRLVEREFNLSFMEAMPGAQPDRCGGRWFAPRGSRARRAVGRGGDREALGWKLGDRLTWQVAGQSFTAPVTSLRKLDWDSMRVNFFVITTPGLLDGLRRRAT